MEPNDLNQSEEFEKIKAQCDEYLAGWKRAQADYANLEREMERERGSSMKYANERLLEDLLPAIDQFETALLYTPSVSSLSEEEAKRFAVWMNGLHAVRSLWEAVFKRIGLEKVPAEGAFDPAIHEAMGSEVNETVGSEQILRVVQSGWRLNGKILRPARVILAA
jgi:molecular chaperone GrpE